MDLAYPEAVIYAVLIIGLISLFYSPFWTFLLTVILFSSVNVYKAIITRISAFGPYFNLYDALFLLAIISIIVDSRSRPFTIPKPVIWVVGILLIGIAQTAIYFEMNYLVIRAIRWSMTFPLAFLIAANNVVDSTRAKQLFYAIIIGSVIGSAITFVEYRDISLLGRGDEAVRMPTAGTPLGGSLLIAATQKAFFPNLIWPLKMLWGGSLVLFGMCILFGQWRAMDLAVILTVITVPLVLRNWQNYWRATIVSGIGLVITLTTLYVAMPWVNPGTTFNRLAILKQYKDPNAPPPREDRTRVLQISRDLEEWYEGNLLLGRGLSFNAFISDGLNRDIAWGHIGYTSYLSNLGIVGLLIYGVFLPLAIVRAGKLLYNGDNERWVVLLGLIAVVTVLSESIMSFMSTSYLSTLKHCVGFLYGAVWALAYKKDNSHNIVISWKDNRLKKI